MCIVFLSFAREPNEDGYKVIIAFNRDEYFNRPTQEAHFWKGNSDIISGIDLVARRGGTWLGISKRGLIGMLTNYRQGPPFITHGKKGRGELVTNFLKSNDDPHAYVEKVNEIGEEYNGFNLIVGKMSGTGVFEFSYCCNQEHKPIEDLKAGVYCLSNRYLDFGWRKVVWGKEKFGKIVQMQSSINDKITLLLELLQDKTRYTDDELFIGPQDDGLPQWLMEACSAISVSAPDFGTRCNTVIIVDNQNNVTYVERFIEERINTCDDIRWKTNRFDFKINA